MADAPAAGVAGTVRVAAAAGEGAGAGAGVAAAGAAVVGATVVAGSVTVEVVVVGSVTAALAMGANDMATASAPAVPRMMADPRDRPVDRSLFFSM